MRKIICASLSGLAIAALTLGSPIAAVAAEPAPVTVKSTVCDSVPGLVTDLAADLVSSGTSLAAATTASGLADTALAGSTASLVSAMVGYINALDSQTNVASRQQILNGYISEYSGAFSAWSNASAAKAEASQAVRNVEHSQAWVTGITAGLACVLPVV